MKIYVDEMPKSPDDCPCNYDTFCNVLCDGINCWSKIREDCPLIDIKTHDRELVKEVCERIRKDLSNKFIYFEGKKEYYKISDILEILDQIQKEFEK